MKVEQRLRRWRGCVILPLLATGCGGAGGLEPGAVGGAFRLHDLRSQATDGLGSAGPAVLENDQPLHDGNRHLDQLVPALNKRLTGCVLRVAGLVGEPSAEGDFRFYLEAVYPDGKVDSKVHFETNHKNVIGQDVDDFLKLIPSQTFKGCRHGTNPDPDPDPNPDPDPDPQPDLEPIRRQVGSIIHFTNEKLTDCEIYLDGALVAPAADGTFEYELNARYAGGTVDQKRKFRSTVKQPVEQGVADILAVVPAQVFKQCKIKGDSPDPGPQPDAARPYVASVLKHANPGLDNCILAISGAVGPVDPHGDFDFYLLAYWQEGGTFLNPARFRGNIHQTPEMTAQVLLRLIPAVEFKQCRLKS